MKRILRISFDILVTSIVPIAGWFLLGIILGGDLINIFTLTYPMQFLMGLIKSIFSTGANISAYKDKNENAINSGIVLGMLVGFVIFGTIILNIDKYIIFMNMDVDTYGIFGIYSIVQTYLQLILQLVLTKLYYREENKKANRIALCFNFINFITLIGVAIITKEQYTTAIISIIILTVYTTIITIKNLNKFKFSINILNCIKYDLVEVFSSISFFIIYLFGFSNAFEFGEKYVLAIAFATLVTDMQWDVSGAISVVSKIDISKKKFDYKEHLRNAYNLIFILIASIIMMSFVMYRYYNIDVWIASIFVVGEIINLIMYPIYIIRTCYLQLEYSAVKTAINKQVSNLIRVGMSFLQTPYCTIVGQLFSMIYQLIYTKILWRNIKVDDLK